MKHTFKCRPAEECCWDDPYYTEEIEVDDNFIWDGKPERKAAEEYADRRCSRRSEYGDMEVQVLLADGWHTFDVVVRSVPEFVASKMKVPPVPDTFRCNECDVRKPKEELGSRFVDLCKVCVAKEEAEDEE